MIVVFGGGLRDSIELYGNIMVINNELEWMCYVVFLYNEIGLLILVIGRLLNGNLEVKVIVKEF